MKKLTFLSILLFNLLISAELRTMPHKRDTFICHKMLKLARPNAFFVGRKQEMDTIVRSLFQDHSKVLFIEGVSGIGKTQLAKQYAHTYSEKYDLIWWFDGDKNLDSQIDQFLMELYLGNNRPYYRPLNSASLFKKLKDELYDFPGSWLIIVDNVDDPSILNEAFLINYGSLAKHVIVTSKKMNKTLPSMKIDKFQRQESIEFLSRNLEVSTKEELNALAELLEDFPSALVQAVSYIKTNPSVNVSTYLQLFKENRLELWMSEQKLLEEIKVKQSLSDQYNKTIATATRINLESLKSSSPLAYKILTFCSLLDHQHIPASVLEHWALGKHGATKIEFHEALSLLLNNFLLEKETGSNVHLASELLTQHELFQFIVMETLSEKSRREMLNEASDFILQELTQSPGTLYEQFKGKEYLSDHLEKISNFADELGLKDPKILELKIALLYFIHYIRRDFEKSSKLINELKSIVDSSKDLSPLAQVWFYCTYCNDQMFEDLSKVRESYKNGLNCVNQIKEEDTNRGYYIHLNMNYMESLSNFGEIKEAITICDNLDELVEKSNNKSEKTAFLGVSAIIRLKYGQYDKALQELDDCLELISEEKGDDRFIPLLMLVKAHCLLNQLQPQKAYQILEQCYPHLLEIFSTPDSMVLVKGKFIKGACLASFGKLDEAQQIVTETLDAYEKSTGFENDTVKGMGYCILGEIFEAKGDLDKSYEEYIKAEKLYDIVLKEKTLDDLSRLYTHLAILGAKQKDEVMVDKYLSLHITHFGLAHPRTFEIKHFLDQEGLSLP